MMKWFPWWIDFCICNGIGNCKETFVLRSLTPWRKLHCLTCLLWQHRALSVCVSFQPALAISNILIPRPPDTAGCHVWRACAWRLAAQGYLKGCANFVLFTAPINSICSGGSLCVAWMFDVGQSMADMQHALSCLLCLVVRLNRLYWCALSPVTFCLTPLPMNPQGQPCHSSPPWRPARGKCRRRRSAGRFKPRKVAGSFPLRFLAFRSLWPLGFSLFSLVASFAPVSISPSLLLLTSGSFPLPLHSLFTAHIEGFNTINYLLTVNTLPDTRTHALDAATFTL